MRRAWLFLFTVGLCAADVSGNGRSLIASTHGDELARVVKRNHKSQALIETVESSECANVKHHTKTFTDSDCEELVELLTEGKSDSSILCNHSCWQTFVAEFELLSTAGCLNQLNAQTISICNPTQQIGAAVSTNEQHDSASSNTHDAPVAKLCENNCSSHGQCVPSENSEMSCICDKGFGRSSSNVSQDCSEFTLSLCPQLCFGHGVCVPQGETFVCSCFDGFEGPTCSSWSRCRDLNFCSGHGVCTQPAKLHATPEIPKCVCDPGFSGPDCSQDISGCPSHCSGHGVCQVQNGTTVCVCDVGYGGSACHEVVAPHCPNSCSAFGECDHETMNCSCSQLATGKDCSQVVNVCPESCHHGYCNAGRCECKPGFSGPTCATIDHPGCASTHFCSGSGICSEANGVAKCMCFEGFSGSDCSVIDVNYENLCPNFCSGNGRCQVGPAGLHCVCDPAWSGSDCSVSACPQTCSNHGICEASEGTFGCVCDTGFSGPDCSIQTPANHLVLAVQPETVKSGPIFIKPHQVVKPARPKLLPASACINSCTSHGACIGGSCVCNKGYEGEDCSRALPSLFENEVDLDSLDLIELSHSMSQLWD